MKKKTKQQKIRDLVKDSQVKNLDLIRLVCLYALRYEKSNSSELSSLKSALLRRPGGLSDYEKEVNFLFAESITLVLLRNSCLLNVNEL